MSHCNDCDKTFASRQSLSNHRKRSHSKTQNEGQRFSDTFHKSLNKDNGKKIHAAVVNSLKSGESTGKMPLPTPSVGKKIKFQKLLQKLMKYEAMELKHRTRVLMLKILKVNW